jgi:hypothetical protein
MAAVQCDFERYSKLYLVAALEACDRATRADCPAAFSYWRKWGEHQARRYLVELRCRPDVADLFGLIEVQSAFRVATLLCGRPFEALA